MAKLDIKILNSVDGARFGSTSSIVHKALGDGYKKEEPREFTDEDKDFLLTICKNFSEMTGKPLDTYTKYIDDDKYDFDNSSNSDYYPFCRIDYDDNDRLEVIEIYADQQTELIIEGKDFSDFNLQKFLTLADDFVSEENNTAWTSYSKQIGIWCPDGDDRVECILFGRDGYYNQ